MGAIQRIVTKLRQYPEVVYRIEAGTITVEPTHPDGFPVSVTEGAGSWLVRFAGWHEEFTTADEAVACVAFGLSDRCRLCIHYRGEMAHRWTLEERTADGWQAHSTVGLLFYPFWRRARVEYRQNSILRAEAEPD